MPINVIATLDDVHALAARILDRKRAAPVVCVTTRHNEIETLIDVEALAAACAPLIVDVLRTGELTFELTGSLPPRFEVYGGAARVWWPGLDPTDDPLGHPLVFCWERHDAAAAVERLLRLLRERGMVDAAPASALKPPVNAVVADPLEGIQVGDVLDAKVTEVYAGGIQVELRGGRRVMILNRRGKTGPAVRPGDVRQVEVTIVKSATDGVDVVLRWCQDTVDGAAVAPAGAAIGTSVGAEPRRVPSPPIRAPGFWPGQIPYVPQHTGAEPNGAEPPKPDDARLESAWVRINAAKAAVEEIHAAAREIPRALDLELAAAQARIVAFAEMAADDIVDDLKRELGEARAEAETLRRRLASAEREQRAAIEDRHRQRDRLNKMEKELRSEKDRRVHFENRLHGRNRFDDPEEQFRHEVTVACDNLRAADATTSTAPVEYILGSGFLKSIARVEGVDRDQIVSTVAEVLTGIRMGRGHPFRVSEAANAAQRIRDADGAKAYRHYLQHKTPGARRLHYWQLRDGTLELANIAVHDDMGIR